MDDGRFTHAGGLVVRTRDGRPEIVVIRPSDGSDAWVLPKGHIEPGEQPEQAAVREVEEEAGVRAAPEEFLGTAEFSAGAERVRAAFDLMSWEADVPALEERAIRWVPLAEAEKRLTHENAKLLVRRAATLLGA